MSLRRVPLQLSAESFETVLGGCDGRLDLAAGQHPPPRQDAKPAGELKNKLLVAAPENGATATLTLDKSPGNRTPPAARDVTPTRREERELPCGCC